jgi:subtilisin family serine protease
MRLLQIVDPLQIQVLGRRPDGIERCLPWECASMRPVCAFFFRFSGLFLSAVLFPAWAAGVPLYVPGRLLAALRPGIDIHLLEYTLKLHAAVVRKQWPQSTVCVLDVPEPFSEAIMESLKRTGLFEYVERDRYARTGQIPNDPGFISEWHLAKIQGPQAWNMTTGSPSVEVAVIDTGVYGTHPDLIPNLAPGWNFVNSNADTSDRLGHGTAVAGTIAAAGNNGIGVTGVSWQSRIMPLVVVDENDLAAYSDLAAAIQYAADRGVRIINISIGGPAPSLTLQHAVDYAWDKGALIFASAMNDGAPNPYYPAACNHVIAVSATDTNDHLASFSNYGSWIAISAPGASILTTTNGGGYAYWFGTSFASPIVAGVAALSLAINPSLTNVELVTILETSADDMGTPGHNPSFGWGRVNAFNAVSAARKTLIERVAAAPERVPRRGGR